MTNNVDFLKPVQVYSLVSDTWSDAEVKVVTCNRVVFKRGDMEEVLPIDSDLFRNRKESRAVPKDNRLDLTKPLVLYVDGCEDVPVKYVGPLHESSRNFPSWFVMEELSGVCDERFFLMRGDGKTDIPGLTVRNKVEPKLHLPLEVGKKYRMKRGWGPVINGFPNDGIDVCLIAHGKYCVNGMYVNPATGKHIYNQGYDVVEGPL